MDIFSYSLEKQLKESAPLADRMRPVTLDQYIGQSHILAPGRLLRRAIQADQLSSVIFYGPPGTGKTTLARIIANTTKAQFLSLNAVLSGVKNIRESIEQARRYREEFRRRTILFIDEVHRFNKAQQDALLPHVENGIIILIGATTENPYFEVNKALVSRSRIFQLKSLTRENLVAVIDQALGDTERGYGKQSVCIEDDAVEHLVTVANGDARAVLNALELAVSTSQKDENGEIRIDLSIAEESIQQKAVLYDKDGDAHFDIISAFIKSMRGSDPDAALYWMAKMIYAGEDPKFIFRRMIIFAAEDVGMADPNALQLVMSAAQAFDYVGMPEGRFHLAESCLYLCTAPKSNTGFAFFDALNSIKKERDFEVPNHIRDASRDKEGFGHGEGYLYPHAYRDHWVAQQYLPTALQGKLFYQPSDQGYEAKIKADVQRRREAQVAAMLEESSESDSDQSTFWEERTMGTTGELMGQLRELFFHMVDVKRDSLTLNINAGSGLLTGEALRRSPEGTVYALVHNQQEEAILQQQFQTGDTFSDLVIQSTSVDGDTPDFSSLAEHNIQFDLIIGRNYLSKGETIEQKLNAINTLMTADGICLLGDNIPGQGQRLSEYLEDSPLDRNLFKKVLKAEEEIYSGHKNSLVNWNPEAVRTCYQSAGLEIQQEKTVTLKTDTLISRKRIEGWFSKGDSNKKRYVDYLSVFLTLEEIDIVKQHFSRTCLNRVVQWKSVWLFVKSHLKQ